MLVSFLIMFREGVEAALIVGIIASYLQQTGRGAWMPVVWIGILLALALSLAVGAALQLASMEFPQKAQELFEAAIGIAAVLVLTSMVFWMRKAARSIKAELHHSIDAAFDGSAARGLGLIAMVFFAVAREGLESVFFLLAIFQQNAGWAPALGAGLYDLETETGCSVIGSTGMHMRLARGADDVRLTEDRTGYTMCMPVPGIYSQMQSNMAATLNVDWILSVAGGLLKSVGVERSKPDLLGHVEGWLAEAKERPPLFHPYISDAGERGPFVDATARASFLGLSASNGFADMVRAVFDGLALAARDCYLAMGPLPRQVRLTGGAARSASLRRILGGALGADIQTTEREEAGAAGAAMIAAVSLGLYGSMAECAKEWVTPCLRASEPADAALARHFDSVFPAYKASREALSPLWETITGQQDKLP